VLALRAQNDGPRRWVAAQSMQFGGDLPEQLLVKEVVGAPVDLDHRHMALRSGAEKAQLS